MMSARYDGRMSYGELAHMANWRIWQTDYGDSTMANRHIANWHMAKCRIPVNKIINIYKTLTSVPSRGRGGAWQEREGGGLAAPERASF